jgi:hypothetical protein
MAMKKTSGGDSPLRQGAGKSFWTLPIFGSPAAVDRDVFWKIDQVFRFFPSGGLYRRRGDVRGGVRWPHTWLAWPRPWPRQPSVWGPCGPLLLLFGSLEASWKNKTSGTCFVQFREYFMCITSETQKPQKTGNWHCGNLLIG